MSFKKAIYLHVKVDVLRLNTFLQSLRDRKESTKDVWDVLLVVGQKLLNRRRHDVPKQCHSFPRLKLMFTVSVFRLVTVAVRLCAPLRVCPVWYELWRYLHSYETSVGVSEDNSCRPALVYHTLKMQQWRHVIHKVSAKIIRSWDINCSWNMNMC